MSTTRTPQDHATHTQTGSGKSPEQPHVRTWWQKGIILLAGAAVIVSLVGSAIFVVVSLRGAFG